MLGMVSLEITELANFYAYIGRYNPMIKLRKGECPLSFTLVFGWLLVKLKWIALPLYGNDCRFDPCLSDDFCF